VTVPEKLPLACPCRRAAGNNNQQQNTTNSICLLSIDAPFNGFTRTLEWGVSPFVGWNYLCEWVIQLNSSRKVKRFVGPRRLTGGSQRLVRKLQILVSAFTSCRPRNAGYESFLPHIRPPGRCRTTKFGTRFIFPYLGSSTPLRTALDCRTTSECLRWLWIVQRTDSRGAQLLARAVLRRETPRSSR